MSIGHHNCRRGVLKAFNEGLSRLTLNLQNLVANVSRDSNET